MIDGSMIRRLRAAAQGIGPRRRSLASEGATMPRYAARRDTTHADVRDGLRRAGFTVFDAGSVGGDFPDLVVGAHGQTFLIEVKSPGGKISDGQSRFANGWKGGPVFVAYSPEAALAHIIKHVRGDKPLVTPYGGPPIAWGER